MKVGEVGEVCAKSPMVMNGYFRQPDATAKTIDSDGFLHTGDLGSLDDEGYLFLEGSREDLIISGGVNVYPAAVESVLAGHPGIIDVAVFPVMDPRWGQRVACAVVTEVAVAAERVYRVVEEACRGGVDCFRIVGGEYATQLMGPRAWDELVVPYDRPLIDLIHAHGAIAHYHNHGYMRRFLPPLPDPVSYTPLTLPTNYPV